MTSDNDKVLDHTRLQLSALFDGELDMDGARFLQRRLEHDRELAGCWSRWQLAGDVLRGQATAAAPAGFADQVAAAVAAEAGAHGARSAHRRRYWMPGAALAASVAALAMFMTRQAPEVLPPSAPQVEIASAAPAGVPDPLPQLPAPPLPERPQAPDSAAQVAAAIAVAEVPRRAAERRSRAQQQRAATTRVARNAPAPRRSAASAAEPAIAVASLPPAASPGANPFQPADAAGAIAVRPWPRALLPQAGGAFNVGYGSLDSVAATGHPFQPRLPAAVAAAEAAAAAAQGTTTSEDSD